MKKKASSFLALAMITFMSACSSSGGADFSFKDDANLPYFSRRGENFMQRSASLNTIETVTVSTDSSLLIRELNKGRSIPFYIYQTSCEHCRKFETKMINYCLDSMTEVYSMEMSGGMDEIYKLIEAFPSYSPIMSELSTPSIFYLNKNEAKEINIMPHISSVDSFEKFIAPTYNNTRIYRYSSFEGFKKCAENTEGLLYIDNGTDESLSFEASALSDAIHHDKRLAWIEWDMLSSNDKESFLDLFGISDEAIVATYKKGGALDSSINYVDNIEAAISFVSSYYAS